MAGHSHDADADAPTLAQSSSDEELASAPTLAPPSGADGIAGLGALGAAGEAGPARLEAGGALGRYQLLARLGEGAMGVVWLARDPKLDRKVAIKVVHPMLARSPDASGRLLREARAMAKLSDRAVVTVHDAGDVGGVLFIAMELVDGTTLGALLRQRTDRERADWRRWLAMLGEAGRGLAAAHSAGVMHRDFKPDNVLVDRSGRVCVADFGLAALGAEPGAGLSQRWALRPPTDGGLELTTTGALLGTPAYMSPQQLRGEPVDARADQFSFCVALWEALFGRRPFIVEERGLEALPALIRAIQAGPSPPDGTSVPRALIAVIARGLAAEPAERWPDMGALLGALAPFGRSGTLAGAAQAGRRPGLRRRWVAAGAVLSAAVAAALTWYALRASEGRESGPVATGVEASVTPQITRLFEVSLRVKIALSDDGRRFAIGSDRLEIRDEEGELVASTPIADRSDIAHVEFDGGDLRFGLKGSSGIRRWRASTDGKIVSESEVVGGAWRGTTVAGELVGDHITSSLSIRAGDGVVMRLPLHGPTEVTAISPDRKRVAYLDNLDQFRSVLIVVDVETGQQLSTGELGSATALSWQDDHSLLYAVGTLDNPELRAVDVGPTSFRNDRLVYSIDRGWFGQLISRAGRTIFIELSPTSRAKLIERQPLAVRDLDQASVGAALAWHGDGEFLTWNRSTGFVEHRNPSMIATTTIRLGGEPVNATVAGEVLIVAVRGTLGRRVEAWSLTNGAMLWSRPEGEVLAVRCAGDREPPCVAIAGTTAEASIVEIDPRTGRLGTRAIIKGSFQDVAVHASGKRLLVPRWSELAEIDWSGAQLSATQLGVSNIRSVAYDEGGQAVVGATVTRNRYEVGVVRDGAYVSLVQAENDVLALVRPSPDGGRVLALSRVYSPVVYEMKRGLAPR